MAPPGPDSAATTTGVSGKPLEQELGLTIIVRVVPSYSILGLEDISPGYAKHELQRHPPV